MEETGIDTALQELETTLAQLLRRSKELQIVEATDGIRCHRYWNPEAKIFTYHTHVVVAGIGPSVIERLSDLSFNAYRLQQHGWYSQFSSGTMRPLPFKPAARGDHQLGQGYFDFGVGALRRYHLLFSRIRIDERTHAVVLRSVPEDVPVCWKRQRRSTSCRRPEMYLRPTRRGCTGTTSVQPVVYTCCPVYLIAG